MKKSVYVAFVCAIGSLLFSACDKNDDGTPVPDRATVIHLSYKVPASSKAETRVPMTRAVDETSIHTVDVLSFKVDPADPTNIKKGKFFYRSRGVYTQITPGEGKVEVTLLGSQVAQTLVVIANARRQVDMLGAVLDEEKEAVMSRLTFDVATEASPDLTGGIPMWGELPNKVVGDNFSPAASPETVTMIRSVAKFTLVAPPIGDPKYLFYYYDRLRLYNYRSKGRIAPDNYNVTDNKVNAPTVPAGARLPRATFTGLNSEVDPLHIGIYESTQKSFYLCEADNTVRPAGGNALDDLCLVVFLKDVLPFHWHGYYRLDFKDYATGNPIDILRNHDYRIVVDEVQGMPADTPEEAFNGRYTLKCKILPWNDVHEDVVVDELKRIKTDKEGVTLAGTTAVTTGETLVITTKNTGGWKIDPTSIPTWVVISPASSMTDGPTTVTIKATQANRIQSVKLKLIGNNTTAVAKSIKVTLIGKMPLEYVAEYNLAGGYQYGYSYSSSVPAGAHPSTNAQTDPALRFANSHDNNQSGYYNWYVCKGVNDVTYNPNTKKLFDDPFFTTGAGKGYHLPSRWEWTSIFPYMGYIQFDTPRNFLNMNEAIETCGTKGTYASDYYCTGNGIGYALRYKQATGNPMGGFSTTDFPKATDNIMACAFRYERIGSMAGFNNTDRLKVQCVYVGNQNPLPNLQTEIAQESWWNNQPAGKVITRIFAATGFVSSAALSSSSGKVWNQCRNSFLWAITEDNNSNAWSGYFDDWGVTSSNSTEKSYGSPLRLFSNE